MKVSCVLKQTFVQQTINLYGDYIKNIRGWGVEELERGCTSTYQNHWLYSLQVDVRLDYMPNTELHHYV